VTRAGVVLTTGVTWRPHDPWAGATRSGV